MIMPSSHKAELLGLDAVLQLKVKGIGKFLAGDSSIYLRRQSVIEFLPGKFAIFYSRSVSCT